MRICICGGGNLGHVIAGFIASQKQHEVRILTRQPNRWSEHIVIETPDGKELSGEINGIYCQPQEAMKGVDIVLLCLPGYSIREMLLQIRDFLEPATIVGSVVSSTGFFFEAMDVLPVSTTLFGFQRVPFISRIVQYGHRARLMGFKDHLHLAVERSSHKNEIRSLLESMLNTPISLLSSFYEASLSNSNPLLHPSRLYSLWHNWHEGEVFTHIPLFYEEWTAEAAQIYMDMDNELQQLIHTLPITPGSISTVLEYYESSDATSLAKKLRSIEAFKGIAAPVRKVSNGYIPDFSSRYFVEDFPYGLGIIHRLTYEKGTPSPTIDRVYEWGTRLLKSHNQ